MRKFSQISTIAMVILALSAPSALADLYVEQTGPAEPAGSWILPLGAASLLHEIDLVGARITSGDPFGSWAIRPFHPSGWSEIMNTGYVAAAAGPAAHLVGLLFHFSGEIFEPLEFDVAAFSNGQLLGAYHGSWSGSGFVQLTWSTWHPSAVQFNAGGGNSTSNPSPMPVPNAAILALTGMACMALFMRRFL